MSKQTYLVETVGITHFRYIVEASSEKEAKQLVDNPPDSLGVVEFSSKWLGETVHNVKQVDLIDEEKYQALIAKYKVKEDVNWWLPLEDVMIRG